jgi:hypothetical protein
MAAKAQAAPTGRDLASMTEVRALAWHTTPADAELAEFSDEHLDDLRVIYSDLTLPLRVYTRPHSRTEPASVRVVPLDRGCAPTGPTLAVVSARPLTCPSPVEILEKPPDTVPSELGRRHGFTRGARDGRSSMQ